MQLLFCHHRAPRTMYGHVVPLKRFLTFLLFLSFDVKEKNVAQGLIKNYLGTLRNDKS